MKIVKKIYLFLILGIIIIYNSYAQANNNNSIVKNIFLTRTTLIYKDIFDISNYYFSENRKIKSIDIIGSQYEYSNNSQKFENIDFKEKVTFNKKSNIIKIENTVFNTYVNLVDEYQYTLICKRINNDIRKYLKLKDHYNIKIDNYNKKYFYLIENDNVNINDTIALYVLKNQSDKIETKALKNCITIYNEADFGDYCIFNHTNSKINEISIKGIKDNLIYYRLNIPNFDCNNHTFTFEDEYLSIFYYSISDNKIYVYEISKIQNEVRNKLLDIFLNLKDSNISIETKAYIINILEQNYYDKIKNHDQLLLTKVITLNEENLPIKFETFDKDYKRYTISYNFY